MTGSRWPSQAGREREAVERLARDLAFVGLSKARLERLKTAVAEAVMNGIEHGNRYRSELPVDVCVLTDGGSLRVQVVDRGRAGSLPPYRLREDPDLRAKLAGLQPGRGWGLFLIRNRVDDLHVGSLGSRHVVELRMELD